jgi:Arc/MetJ-type ribon-helix-helix transcriptional regulator
MNSYNISIPDNLNNFLKQAITEGGYTDENEYINELLNKRRINGIKELSRNLSDLEKLELFNIKAERLENYQLWQYMADGVTKYAERLMK